MAVRENEWTVIAVGFLEVEGERVVVSLYRTHTLILDRSSGVRLVMRKQITPTKTTQRLWRHAVIRQMLDVNRCDTPIANNRVGQPTRSPDRAYEASPSSLDTHPVREYSQNTARRR